MKDRPSEEQLARALGAFVREEGGRIIDDPCWDALARGEATPEQVAELTRLAEEDATAREALALFQPVGDEAKERYAAAIVAELGGAASAELGGSNLGGSNLGGSNLGAPQRRDPAPKRRVLRWIAPASAALALAAGIALFVSRQPPEPSLPGYAIALTGGVATSRSLPAAEGAVLAPGARFTVVLSPATAAAGAVAARVFLVQGDLVEVVEADAKVSPDGAVRLLATLSAESHAEPGTAEIVAVVARPEALPAVAEVRTLADGEGRRVARRAVRIAERR